MTVKELKKELEKFDDNLPIEIWATFDCGYGWAGGKDIYLTVENNALRFYEETC